jgi:hypothetical protein
VIDVLCDLLILICIAQMNINMRYRINNEQSLKFTLIGSGHVIRSNRNRSGYSSYINS